MRTTIVLSSYNGGKYIIEQLESLRCQTLKPDEVIIVDDRSTDSTADLCRQFIADHQLDSWRVIVNEQNKGWAENFSDAFLIATGDLIFPCDQDDIWLEDKLEKMVDTMESHPEIELLIGNYMHWIQNSNEDRITDRSYSGKLSQMPFDNKVIFVDYPGCVYCFRRSFYDRIFPYRFKDYPHDAFLLRMAKVSDSCYLLDVPVIKWRRHSSNATGKPVRSNAEMAKRCVYYADCLMKMKSYCKDHGISGKDALLDSNIEFYKIRESAFRNKRLVGKDSLFSCIRYIRFYPRYRSILGDVWRLLH